MPLSKHVALTALLVVLSTSCTKGSAPGGLPDGGDDAGHTFHAVSMAASWPRATVQARAYSYSNPYEADTKLNVDFWPYAPTSEVDGGSVGGCVLFSAVQYNRYALGLPGPVTFSVDGGTPLVATPSTTSYAATYEDATNHFPAGQTVRIYAANGCYGTTCWRPTDGPGWGFVDGGWWPFEGWDESIPDGGLLPGFDVDLVMPFPVLLELPFEADGGLTPMSRSADWFFTWDAGAAPVGTVLFSMASAFSDGGAQELDCEAPASANTLTVPSALIAQYGATGAAVSVRQRNAAIQVYQNIFLETLPVLDGGGGLPSLVVHILWPDGGP